MYQFHAQVLFDSAYMNRFGARKGFNLVYWSLRKIKKRLVKQQREMLETLSQLEIGEGRGWFRHWIFVRHFGPPEEGIETERKRKSIPKPQQQKETFLADSIIYFQE